MIKKFASVAAVKNDSAVTAPSPHICASRNNEHISTSEEEGKLN